MRGDGWLLSLTGSVTTVATVALLLLRPMPLPSWLPGSALSGSSTAVPAGPTRDGAALPFSVTAGDGQVTVSWPIGTAWTHYRAEATDERIIMPTVGCRPNDPGPGLPPRCTLTGLRNGEPYLVSVLPADAHGSGVPVRTTRVTPRPDVLAGKDLALWLDPSDLSSVSSGVTGPARIGSRVQGVQDRSTHHTDATQPDNGLQPTIGQLGPLPALALNGVQVLGVSAQNLPSGSAASTVVMVAAQDDNSPDRTTCFHNLLAWGSAQRGEARIIHKGCYTSLAFAETFDASVDQRPTLAWPVGKPVVVSARFDRTGTSLRMNGTTSYRWRAPADQAMNTVDSAGVDIGGAPWDPRAGWSGRIGDVMVFDRDLTAAELSSVERYLAAKWQLLLAPS